LRTGTDTDERDQAKGNIDGDALELHKKTSNFFSPNSKIDKIPGYWTNLKRVFRFVVLGLLIVSMNDKIWGRG
jgi:hypothetical protein